MSDRIEPPSDSRVAAVLALHTERWRTVDGYGLRWCVECQQDWPCATVRAIREAADD